MRVVTAEQMRALDRAATEQHGIPSLMLMERAGQSLAQAALRVAPGSHPRLVAVCGRGNNGGDGLAAARLLAADGARVTVLLAAAAGDLKGDAAINLARLQGMGVLVVESASVPLPPADLLLDCLFGTGLSRAPEGGARALIEAMNACGVPVVTADVPSGLDADTGRPPGVCVCATETVTFALPKPGLLLYPGAGFCGRLAVADIGFPPSLSTPDDADLLWTTETDGRALLPPVGPEDHKGSRGRVLVVAGSCAYSGAPCLCSEAAMRIGAGLAVVAVPRSIVASVRARVLEVIPRAIPDTAAGAFGPPSIEAVLKELEDAKALAIGPGLGRAPETGEFVKAILAAARVPAVLDADGLFVLAGEPGLALPGECVLTPHPGEAARLLGRDTAAVQQDRLGSAREAARRFGRVVVLKGTPALIATPDGRVRISSTGSPVLATAGTGDVLTGILTGLLARGLAPVDAATLGLWVGGRAAEMLAAEIGVEGGLAGDLLPYLPRALRALRSGH